METPLTKEEQETWDILSSNMPPKIRQALLATINETMSSSISPGQCHTITSITKNLEAAFNRFLRLKAISEYELRIEFKPSDYTLHCFAQVKTEKMLTSELLHVEKCI